MLNASFFSKSACKTVALAALMSVGLVACDQNAETTEMSLDSQEQRISYGIAMNMGRRMKACLLYTSPSPRDRTRARMPSSA